MKPKVRMLRMFIRWLRAERGRFRHPVRINRITRDTLYFNFEGITAAICGSFRYGPKLYSSIDVWVRWGRNYNWDLLFDQGLVQMSSAQGWYCSLCLPEFIKYYPSREMLLVDHSFESLLKWCNETLSCSKFMELRGVEDRWSEAVLLKERSDFQKSAKYDHEGCRCHLIKVIL